MERHTPTGVYEVWYTSQTHKIILHCFPRREPRGSTRLRSRHFSLSSCTTNASFSSKSPPPARTSFSAGVVLPSACTAEEEIRTVTLDDVKGWTVIIIIDIIIIIRDMVHSYAAAAFVIYTVLGVHLHL